MLVPVEDVGKGHVADRADRVDLRLLLPLLLYFCPRMALVVLVLLSRILILLRLLGEKMLGNNYDIFYLANLTLWTSDMCLLRVA